MTSSPHGPYAQGYTRATMVGTKGSEPRGEPIPKSRPQFGLESATRLHEVESLVIADQHAAVNTFPGLVHTARHTMEVCCTRSRVLQPFGEAAAQGMADDWGEVVTR